jgi:hypothetical protein
VFFNSDFNNNEKNNNLNIAQLVNNHNLIMHLLNIVNLQLAKGLCKKLFN